MKQHYYRLIIFTFTFLSCTCLKAQTDTTFWFAVPNFAYSDVSVTYILDRPVYFNITTYANPAVVTIATPAGNMATQTINIPANSTNRFNATSFMNSFEISGFDQVTNQGIKINSTQPISVYYEIASTYSPELFALKGKNALGTNFYFSSQNIGYNNTAVPTSANSINIVAVENNTQVTINPKQAVVGHAANVPYTITLNSGQTYATKSISNSAAAHLQGSSITSTKPIAVTIGDDDLKMDSYGTCSDIAGDQTVPVNIVGVEYIAVPASLNSPYDKVFVTATQNNTTISVAGAIQSTINAGDTYMITLTNNQPAYITTSKPAYSYIMTGFGCEFGTAILPKLNCTGSKNVSVVRTSVESALATIVVKAGAQNNFTVNGNAGLLTGAAFNAVPGTNGQWLWAKYNVTTVSVGGLLNIQNSAAPFQMGFIQGGPGSGCSVGYFSDFGALNTQITASQNPLCTGSSVTLSSPAINGATYQWTGAGLSQTSANPLVIPSVTTANNGWFYLSTSSAGCNATDSLLLSVNQQITSTINHTVCNGQPYLGYTTSGTYTNTFTLPSGCDSVRTLNLTFGIPITKIIDSSVCEGVSVYGYNSSGNYTNVFTGSNGCDSTRILNLTVKPKKFTTINQQICQGQTYLGYSTSGTYSNTFTAANGCDSIRTLNLSVVSTITSTVNKIICLGQSYLGYTASGTYSNTFVSAAGCDSVRTLLLVVKPPQFTSESKSICEGTSYLGHTTAGVYASNVPTAEGCDSTHTLTLSIKPRKYSNITQTICQGSSYLGYTNAGTYRDTLISSIGCDSIRTLVLTVKPKSFNTISQSICEGTSFLGFSTAGTHVATLLAANGCDSVLTINLTIKPKLRSTINQSICEGQIFQGYNSSGTYSNTFAGSNGCDSIRTLNLTVQQPPSFSLGTKTEICIGDSLQLSPGNFLSYVWQDGSTVSSFWVKKAGLYSVSVTNDCGSTTKSITITENSCTVYFPNSFTPNADGLNDFFKALNPSGITKFELLIYNRFGQLLYSSQNKLQGWDGRFGGKELPQAAYVFISNFIVNQKAISLKGNVLLIR